MNGDTNGGGSRSSVSARTGSDVGSGFFAFFTFSRGSPRVPAPTVPASRASARGPGASPRVGRGASSASTSRAGGRYSSDSAAYADESDPALAFASLGKDESSGRARGAGGGGSGTEGGGGTSRVSTATRASTSGFVGGATTAGAGSATAAGLGFGSSMGTVSSLAFFARAALNASSFARPFAAAADLPAMAPQARRGHRRRAVPACAHPRAPPSAGGRSVVGPDDAVSWEAISWFSSHDEQAFDRDSKNDLHAATTVPQVAPSLSTP